MNFLSFLLWVIYNKTVAVHAFYRNIKNRNQNYVVVGSVTATRAKMRFIWLCPYYFQDKVQKKQKDNDKDATRNVTIFLIVTCDVDYRLFYLYLFWFNFDFINSDVIYFSLHESSKTINTKTIKCLIILKIYLYVILNIEIAYLFT